MNDKRRREVEAALMTMQLGDIRVSTLHNPFYAQADNLGSCWAAREALDGESISFLRFDPAGAELFRSSVEGAMRRPEGLKQWCLSVIDGLAHTGLQVGVLSIEGLAWGEMDFPADVKRNEKITSAWVRPGEFNRAAEAG
jgi:choline kinase